ncbi:hypothetical protein [Streptomyces sp. NPDC004134]|uniref:hypothetical protein n=1 Tax=Streptomyces sp. NPDC004134 TaxID=3364691 RepID=UPI003696C8E5
MTDGPRAAPEPRTREPQQREPAPPTPAEDLAEALEEAFGPRPEPPAVTSLHSPPAAGEAGSPGAGAAEAEGSETAAPGGQAASPGAAAAGHPGPRPARPAPPSASAPSPAAPAVRPRRGSADPVRGLMYRHRELCRRAVDPLEIAAGLEAHGVTDRTAVRYRHRDVFSLAEEMYVRTRRPGAEPPPPVRPQPRAPLAPLAHLLPLGGGLLVLGAAGLHGRAQVALTAAGVAWAVVALVLGSQRGPLRVRAGLPPAAGLAVGWLLAYAVYGDWFLGELLGGATGVTRAPVVPYATAAALAALTAAVLPAAAVARWFAARARRALRDSRDLAEFRARVRPLLAAAVAAVLAVLAALQLAAAAAGPALGEATRRPAVPAAACALGALLFLARLLAVHGFPRAAAYGLAAACAAQVTALLLVLAARVPGLAVLGRPVELLVAGPAGFRMAAVPAVACGAAALALLAYAGRALTRASAHRKEHNEMTAPPLATPSPNDGGAR